MWVADCPNCDYRTEDVSDRKPGRETRCPECKTWIQWEQISYESKEYSKYDYK